MPALQENAAKVPSRLATLRLWPLAAQAEAYATHPCPPPSHPGSIAGATIDRALNPSPLRTTTLPTHATTQALTPTHRATLTHQQTPTRASHHTTPSILKPT